MLYGLEDYAYDEFGLKKKKKLNIKTILLFIVIILACIFLIYIVFRIISNNLDTPEIKKTAAISEEERAKLENPETVASNQEAIVTKKENNKTDIFKKSENGELVNYTGDHMQIPSHDMEGLKSSLTIPQFNESGFDLVRDIYFSEEKQVYLTFDDGPSKDVTPQILDILKEHDVKATFFVLGARVDLYPEITKRAFEEGHYIANHGYSHEYSKIYENKDTVFQEYVECDNSIRNAIGNPDFNSYLFRFPGGSSGGRYEKIKAQAREHFKSYGVAFTNWNCLTGDAEGKDTNEECFQEFMNTKNGRNSLVVLMHDSNEKVQTVEALPDIIVQLKNEGYTFKTFYEIF